MGHQGVLAVALLLVLVAPGSAVNVRQESQKLRGADTTRNIHKEVLAGPDRNDVVLLQEPEEAHTVMNYQIPAAKKEVSKDGATQADDDSDDDEESDDDDEESDEDKAASKARDAKEEKLRKAMLVAKAKLEENREEQEEISRQLNVFETSEGDMEIDGHVKAVANETESTSMAGYLGDMWKEQRMFQSPFFQEKLMERQIHLKRREKTLQKRYKAMELKLKKQKLEVEKEDAEGDAEDETDADKKKEDEKKVAKLEKEEKKVDKEEKSTKLTKKEKKVEEEEKAFDITQKPPWMRDREDEEPEAKKEKAAPAEDNTVKPDWMKGMDSPWGKKEAKKKSGKETVEDDEADDKVDGKKKKASKKSQDDEEDEDDKADDKVEDKKKSALKKDDAADDEDFDITDKPPWMKEKEARQKARKAKPKKVKKAKKPVDNTVKPDWMKSLESDDDDEDSDKKSADDKKEPTEKKKKEKKEDTDDEDDDDDEEAATAQGKGKEEKKEKRDKKEGKDDEDEDSDDFDITDKPPWMKAKEARQKARKAQPKKVKKAKKPVDNTVKPDWMKTLETDDDDEDSTDEEATAGQKKGKKAKKAKKVKSELKEVPAPPAAAGDNQPMFTGKTMPRVSPAVECVMVLAWQFFIVYTALALLRTINQISQNRFGSCLRAQELVEMICPYVMFAPMLCVLFLICRMRAIQLTQGDTDKYDLPQPWVQMAMYAATYGVMWQAVLKLLTFMLRLPGSRTEDGSLSVPGAMCSLAKYTFMAMIYGGFTAVCIGTLFMPVPQELWADKTPPPVGAALGCTMMLTTTFFVIYLGLSLFRTVEELRPSLLDDFNVLVKVQLLFWRARHTVNLAPMLGILFIVAQLHSLRMETKVPMWAQTAMHVAAGAVTFQVVASIMLPLIDRNAYILPGPVQGQIILVMSIAPLRIVGDLMRYIPLLLMYGGAAAVVVSMHSMTEGQAGQLSSTANCTIALTTLYFAVFTLVFVAQTVVDRLPESNGAKRVITVLDAGQRTVMFAPMLCVLFIAAMLRATQLTRTVDGRIPVNAGPQKWVQDGMYFATAAVFVQVLAAYLTTTFLGPGFGPPTDAMDRDDLHAPTSTATDPQVPGSSGDKRSLSPNRAVGMALELFKFLCLVAMYGGAVAVMVGIVTMTPETLPPYQEGHSVAEAMVKML